MVSATCDNTTSELRRLERTIDKLQIEMGQARHRAVRVERYVDQMAAALQDINNQM